MKKSQLIKDITIGLNRALFSTESPVVIHVEGRITADVYLVLAEPRVGEAIVDQPPVLTHVHVAVLQRLQTSNTRSHLYYTDTRDIRDLNTTFLDIDWRRTEVRAYCGMGIYFS